MRGVQQARKDAGLHVADRIQLALALPAAWRPAAESFRDWIAEQTLAWHVDLVDRIDDPALSRHEARFGDHALEIGIAPTTKESPR